VAAKLFAQHGPNNVSVRDIAACASVSHALVHRYLGSKDDILLAAIALSRDEAAADLGRLGGKHGGPAALACFDAEQPLGRYLRLVMLAKLDGYELPASLIRLPHAPEMTAEIADMSECTADAGPFDPRLLFAATTAMLGGMSLAGDFFLAQSGLDAADWDALRGELGRLVTRLFSLSE